MTLDRKGKAVDKPSQLSLNTANPNGRRHPDGPEPYARDIGGVAEEAAFSRHRESLQEGQAECQTTFLYDSYLPATEEAAEASRLVFLRFELTQDNFRLTRWEWWCLWATTFTSLGLLIGLAIPDQDKRALKLYYYVLNVAFGGALWFICAAILIVGTANVWQARHKIWTSFRAFHTATHYSILALQVVHLSFYIIPNAYVIAHRCSLFHPLVTWSYFIRSVTLSAISALWLVVASQKLNIAAKKSKLAGLDCRISLLVRVLHSWPFRLALETVFFSGSLFCALFFSIYWTAWRVEEGLISCSYGAAGYILREFTFGLLVGNFLLVVLYLSYGLWKMRSMPYHATRITQLSTRLFFWATVTCYVLLITAYGVGEFQEIGECGAYLFSMFGWPPAEVCLSIFAAYGAVLYMPQKPNEEELQRSYHLRRFAWLERDYRAVADSRKDAKGTADLTRDPLFCFETALKMMKFSIMTYARPGHYGLTSEEYFRMLSETIKDYDLDSVTDVYERTYKSLAIVAKKNDRSTIVVAFRGTSNLANVKVDLRAWPVYWPRDRGWRAMKTLCICHGGFVHGYTKNGFNTKLLKHVADLMEESEQRPKVFITGHSLGGAYAAIFTNELTWHFRGRLSEDDVVCYTFAAPPVGTQPLAQDTLSRCKDCWAVQNKHDPIVWRTKLFWLQAHTGHKAVIAREGDLLIRPGFWEDTFADWLGLERISDHQIVKGYRRSFWAITKVAENTCQLDAEAQPVLEQHLRFADRAQPYLGGTTQSWWKRLLGKGKERADKDRDDHEISLVEDQKQSRGGQPTGDLGQGIICIGPYDPRNAADDIDVSILE